MLLVDTSWCIFTYAPLLRLLSSAGRATDCSQNNKGSISARYGGSKKLARRRIPKRAASMPGRALIAFFSKCRQGDGKGSAFSFDTCYFYLALASLYKIFASSKAKPYPLFSVSAFSAL